MQPNLKQLQRAFTAHVRDPEHQPLPQGVSATRMRVYEELIYNNLNSTLVSAFPILHKILPTDTWQQRVRDFLIHQRVHTPYFHHIPEVFLQFLQQTGLSETEPDFMLELAHYEWVELALFIAEDPPAERWHCTQGDYLRHPLVLSPLAWAFAYRYPVHHIGPDYQPDTPPDTPSYLVIYRTKNNQVKFMQINAVTATLIDIIKQQPTLNGEAILKQVADVIRHPKPQVVVDSGSELFKQLHAQDIVLGVKQ